MFTNFTVNYAEGINKIDDVAKTLPLIHKYFMFKYDIKQNVSIH